MGYLRILAGVEIRAAVAGVGVLFIGALYLVVGEASRPRSLLSPLAALQGAFVYALIFGLPVGLLIGAPVYAFLSYKRMAWWSTALFVGAAPGLVLLYTVNDYGLGVAFIVYGIGAALL